MYLSTLPVSPLPSSLGLLPLSCIMPLAMSWVIRYCFSYPVSVGFMGGLFTLACMEASQWPLPSPHPATVQVQCSSSHLYQSSILWSLGGCLVVVFLFMMSSICCLATRYESHHESFRRLAAIWFFSCVAFMAVSAAICEILCFF